MKSDWLRYGSRYRWTLTVDFDPVPVASFAVAIALGVAAAGWIAWVQP